MAAPARPFTPAELVRQLKADLGAIVRRAEAETLTEEEFAAISSRMRRHLRELEVYVADEEPMIELTDLGASIGRLINRGLIGPHTELLNGPERGRRHRHLVAIDGGLNPS